jgi:hypothetical protein
MKKIIVISLLLAMALAWSCKKNEDKKVSTTINGTLIVNGTNDAIKISKELKKPQVLLYHRHGAGVLGGGGPQWDEVTRTKVDMSAKFSMELDLIQGDEYFLVFEGCDPDLYIETINGYNTTYFPVTAGQTNNVKLYVLAYSWVRPRFINTNPDPNNNDVFKYVFGLSCDNCGSAGLPPVFHGSTDSTLYWIGKTWSGTNQYGIPKGHNNYHPHEVHGKLTRNGVTRDTAIIYTVPPYDTSVVEIRY